MLEGETTGDQVTNRDEKQLELKEGEKILRTRSRNGYRT